MRVGLAQFIYESNTFNPVPAELECFTNQGTWLTDAEDIRQWSGQAETQMSGSLCVLEAAGSEAVPVWVAVCGTPGGRLSTACWAEVRKTWTAGLRAAFPLDALILHLHGAVCAEGMDDVEGALLAMVREELGFTGKIVLSLDLHANVTPHMLVHADIVTAYRTAPHEDFAQTGERAARLLLDAPAGTSRSLAKMAALIPPTSTNHREGPFAEMLAAARQEEVVAGILDVSLFPVQPWLDVEDLGPSVVVTASDEEAGRQAARRLAQTWYAQRDRWTTGLRMWDEIRAKLASRAAAPWILVDTADATSGGSPGSSAEAIVRLWPDRGSLEGTILLWVVDPGAVAQGFAGQTRFHLGDHRFPVEGEVNFVGECRFRPRGRAYTGQEISCGRALVVAAGQLRIVLTEQGCLCSDPAFYEAVGLDPESALAVHVKSLLSWQPGYDAAPERGLCFDGAGATSLDFSGLPFEAARHGLFPLDQTPLNPISLWQST